MAASPELGPTKKGLLVKLGVRPSPPETEAVWSPTSPFDFAGTSPAAPVGLGLVGALAGDALRGNKVLFGVAMRAEPMVLKLPPASLLEIAASEDYTRIVSRGGGDAKTVHIFGDFVVEEYPDEAMDVDEAALIQNCSADDHQLKFCDFCDKLLSERMDIYIYRGETAFCSSKCRKNFMEENDEEDSQGDEKMAVVGDESSHESCIFEPL